MVFSCLSESNKAASGSGVFHADVPFPIIRYLMLNFDQSASYHKDIVAVTCVGSKGDNKTQGEQRIFSPGSSFKTARRYKGKIIEFNGSITKLELEPNKVSLSASYDFGQLRLMGGGGIVETITFTAIAKTDASCDIVYSFACLPITWQGRLSLCIFRKNFVDAGHDLLRGDMQFTIAEAKRRMLDAEKKNLVDPLTSFDIKM